MNKIWTLLRVALGWIFLWAFVDKVFGLGFATLKNQSWLEGVSPTYGFLKFGTDGPLASFFQSLAGNTVVDWLFMIGLLIVGVGLIFNIKIKFTAYIGALMLLLMWLAILPPVHNPIIDEHIIYILVLIGLAVRAE